MIESILHVVVIALLITGCVTLIVLSAILVAAVVALGVAAFKTYREEIVASTSNKGGQG